MEHLQWRSKGAVTNGYLRDNYSEWIDSFLKIERLLERKEELKRKRSEIREIRRALPEVKKTFIRSFENFLEAQDNEYRVFILKHVRDSDPVARLRHEHPDSLLRVNAEAFLDRCDQIFDGLANDWPENALSDAQRKKKYDAYEKEIAQIDKEAAKYPDFPAWLEFVTEWRSINMKVRDGANPQGFSITLESVLGEKQAFAKLAMGQFNNPKSQFLPAAIS